MALHWPWPVNKKLSKALSLKSLKTDMHSHLLPGLDDGVSDMDEALLLADRMQQLGYEKLITTPHIMADLYPNRPEQIQQGARRVNEALRLKGLEIRIEAAAEYLLDEAFMSLLKEGKLMSFGQNQVLVELPWPSEPPGLDEMLFEMQLRGYKIILAHPERYGFWHGDFQKLEALHDRVLFFQLNLLSVSGHYSAEVKRMAKRLIEANMIDYLGTDLHRETQLEKLRE